MSTGVKGREVWKVLIATSGNTRGFYLNVLTLSHSVRASRLFVESSAPISTTIHCKISCKKRQTRIDGSLARLDFYGKVGGYPVG